MTQRTIKLSRAQIREILWLGRYGDQRETTYRYGSTTKFLERCGIVNVKLNPEYPKYTDCLVSLTDAGLEAARQLEEQGFNVFNTRC